MGSNCAKWLEAVCATVIKSAERRAPSAEAMTAPRAREPSDPPAPPDRRPPRRGGGSSPSTYAASAAGGPRGLVRSARRAALAAAGARRRRAGRRARPRAAGPGTEHDRNLVGHHDDGGDNHRHHRVPVMYQIAFSTSCKSTSGLPPASSVAATTMQSAPIPDPEIARIALRPPLDHRRASLRLWRPPPQRQTPHDYSQTISKACLACPLSIMADYKSGFFAQGR